jgi:2-iminobutanoate/2-iminopropanoate deaminase
MKRVIYPKNVFNPQKSRHGDPQGVPWSHAIVASGTILFVAGQGPVDMDGKMKYKGDIVKQTDLALQNLKKVVESAGFKMKHVVQLMWFVTDADRFYKEKASAVRRKYFKGDYPVSTLVEIKRLADPDGMVEVQAVAVRGGK